MTPENSNIHSEFEARLRFETLIAELSTKFINLPPAEVDQEIEDAQRRVCESLGLDLSSLYQWSAEKPYLFRLTHLYRAMEGPPIPEQVNATDYFPWCQKQILAGKMIVLSSIEKAPPEAARDQEVWRHFGVKASLTFPLIVGNEPPIGALGFDDLKRERPWTDMLIQRLRLIAQIFAGALARKQAELTLRESEERLKLVTDSARAGLWSMSLNTKEIWVNRWMNELFQLPATDTQTYEKFMRVIHPEDREAVHQEIQKASRTDIPLVLEYRIVLADGSIRWIVTRGHRYGRSTDEPGRLMGISFDITETKLLEIQLQERLQEIERLKLRLERENVYLKEESKLLSELPEIVGQSPVMKKVLAQAKQVALTDATVLILGETGTGKELLAQAIHNMSRRKDRLIIKVGCSSLPPSLIENELFGREKGAYTGALTRMIGRFEIADGSTLFLDEIGELPLELQSKLLRVLEEGNFERLGSTKSIHVNVRIIAATNRNLQQEVKEGKFRSDLFYRLNVFPVTLPPLREREEDIPLLIRTFVKEFNQKMGKRIQSIPQKTMDLLRNYSWPGNIRQLRNIIEHAIIISEGEVLQLEMPPDLVPTQSPVRTMREAEYQSILDALKRSGWRIKGPEGAAEILKLNPSTLYGKMKKLGIPFSRSKDRIQT